MINKDATSATINSNLQFAQKLPFADQSDFANADRGFMGRLEPCVIKDEEGKVVWDNDVYDFLQGECPATVNPSLWRQSTLTAKQGLYEIVPGMYQVRGLDLSHITFVEGERGIIVIDPLISVETAAAALDLYRRYRGERPVTAVIYTHSHGDHFGGVKGIVDEERVKNGECPIIAPTGFMEHAISENVYAGTAMSRRASYMYGAALDKGVKGQVGSGLGQTTSAGTVTLIPPTLLIEKTGQKEIFDGVEIIFQLTPGTEAPAEMNFFFPRWKALCMAENTTHNLHNILTLRGALVRDPRVWAHYITEAISLFGEETEVLFATHHWPTWGNIEAVEYLSLQRDLYAYLHDQTLRLINQGYTGIEIAEMIEMPPALEDAWHTRGYYGTVNHNVKAVYQRYMGWYDGNPAHLWTHPPVEAAKRYVAYMGGSAAVIERARQSFAEGDYRWVVEVLNHVIFAEQDNQAAREILADAYEQLGYGTENGPWRCIYLSAARELRFGPMKTPVESASPDLLRQLTPTQLFDSLAIRVNGPRAWNEYIVVGLKLTTSGQEFHLRLKNGVLSYSAPLSRQNPDVILTLPDEKLLVLLSGQVDLHDLAAAEILVEGDVSVLLKLISLLDEPDPNFAIVTPEKE